MRERGRSLSVVLTLAVLAAVVLSVAAVAQDSNPTTKRKKKPTEVSVVQSVPLEVTATVAPLPVSVSSLPAVTVSAIPPVEVSSLPPVTVTSLPPTAISSLPPVAVASLPAVEVSSMPAVSIAGLPLDVRVVNTSVATVPPSNTVVTLTALDGATLTADTTSAEIDCDGYRAVTVFMDKDDFATTPTASTCILRFEFGCNGIFARDLAASPDVTIPNRRALPLVASRDVLGPRMRIQVLRTDTSLPFPTINNAKVVVYLRR